MAEPVPSRVATIPDEEFFRDMQMLQKKRQEDMTTAAELQRQIKNSGEIIKASADERLRSAAKISYDKMEDALCAQFILGGVEGKADLYTISILPGLFPRTVLKVSVYPLAIRVEENPAFPLFIIATDGNLNDSDRKFCKKLEGHMKRLVKPYMWAPQSLIEDYIKWKRMK